MKPWRSLALTLSILAVNLVGINQAHAIADGTINCGTSGTFSIVSNIVTTNTDCRGSVVIPEGVTEIGSSAFNRSPDRSSFITSIIFPNSLRTIRESAFRAASSLTSIDFGTGIQSIVHWNFADSVALTSVTIPSTVTSIGVGVFYGSNLLESVTFLGNAPSVDSNAFNGLKVGAVANVAFGATGYSANGSTWKYLTVSVASPPLTAPGAPTIGTASALTPTSASISFTAPTSNGGATIETYTATSTPGSLTARVFQSGSGSITVTGLTASTAYTFRITASNSVGTSSASSATVSITMPASEEELAAQAAAQSAAKLAAETAARKAAEAKREAEKKAARLDITDCFSQSKLPTLIQFNSAEIYGVTNNNISNVISDVNNILIDESATALNESKVINPIIDNTFDTILIVEKVVKKYVIMDSICLGGEFINYYAPDLAIVDLIPAKNQTAITYNLRKLPANQKNDYAKIKLAIAEEIETIQHRQERLALVLLWDLIRNNQEVG